LWEAEARKKCGGKKQSVMLRKARRISIDMLFSLIILCCVYSAVVVFAVESELTVVEEFSKSWSGDEENSFIAFRKMKSFSSHEKLGELFH
jgi:hypothetical protein